MNVRWIGIRANRIEIFAVLSPVKRMKKTMKRSHRAAHLNVVTARYGIAAGVVNYKWRAELVHGVQS